MHIFERLSSEMSLYLFYTCSVVIYLVSKVFQVMFYGETTTLHTPYYSRTDSGLLELQAASRLSLRMAIHK
jgi:hypothetical protein